MIMAMRITNINFNPSFKMRNEKVQSPFSAKGHIEQFFADSFVRTSKKIKSPKQTTPIADIEKSNTIQMMQGFFANNNPKLDELLSTVDFTQYGKDGIPLTYSRKEFLDDLSSELAKLPTKTQAKIIKKLDIEPIKNKDGKITGYNGIIDLSQLSPDGEEGKILSFANKFIKENSVTTGNIELDNALNSLIKGMSEFINVIGKQQHKTHELSVDSHILAVLKNVISNPEYKNLPDADKFCLKFVVIMHDIAKSEGVIDEEHPKNSALYANDILDKYNLTNETKNRIFEFIQNHHWLKDYNTGVLNPVEVATIFRRTNDLKMARIFAQADLKGVNERFYNRYKSALDDEHQKPILEALAKINEEGQMFLSNSIIDKSKVPVVKYHGKKYQVINFSKLSPNTDLAQYGFEPNTTVDNLRLLIHTVSKVCMSQSLENILMLGKSAYQGFLSTSFISLKKKETFCNYKFGVALQAQNANIANAASHNQVSGNEKKFDNFINIIAGSDHAIRYRYEIPHKIAAKLGMKMNITQYGELFSKIQKYKHISQLDNIQPIIVEDKTYTGAQIKEAITSANNSIIASDRYNEVNVYTPQVNAVIAKVDSLKEVPKELLAFANEHDLPIFLLGK